jgi:hypothetical protein
MKLRYDKSFRSKYKVILVVAIMAIAGVGGWYGINHHKQIDSSGVSSNNFQPGVISITFNDGVTFQQAKELITSYNLSLEQPDTVYMNSFTPWDYRAVKTEQFGQIRTSLKAFPEVTSFEDASNDGSSRAGSGYTWVKVTFRQDTTTSQIVAILKSSGLGLGQTPDHPIIVLRSLDLKVPDGDEDSYLKKFKQKPIVQAAERVDYPVPI